MNTFTLTKITHASILSWTLFYHVFKCDGGVSNHLILCSTRQLETHVFPRKFAGIFSYTPFHVQKNAQHNLSVYHV